MQGWTYEYVQSLPRDVYDELIAMLVEDASKSKA